MHRSFAPIFNSTKDHALLLEDRDQWRTLSEQIESLGAQSMAEAQQSISNLTSQKEKLESDLAAAEQKNDQMDRMLKRLTQIKK